MQVKEIYRLWWEYLKRSKDYKELCEWARKAMKNSELLCPEKFRNDDNGAAHPLVWTFMHFEDVHKESFREWWEDGEKLNLENAKIAPADREIVEYSELIGCDIENFINSFKRKMGREPTLREFKDFFISRGKTWRDEIYLVIKVTGETTETIVKEVRKVVSERKKEVCVREIELGLRKSDHKPCSTVRPDELKRYLDAYDLKKQGLKIKEIAERIGTKAQRENSDSADVLRVIRSDIQKAKKIIKNVERGYFPGKY